MRTWGGHGTFIWTWAKRGGMARIWEEYDSVLSMTSTPERPNLSSSTAAAPGPARARGENSKPGRKIRLKVNGGLTTGVCWAPWRFTGMGDLFHCTLDPSLGACVGLEGEHRAANGQPKVNRGHATGACWAPWAVHRDRRLHRMCYLNRGLVDAIEAASTPKS
jgi:hypothetical protein